MVGFVAGAAGGATVAIIIKAYDEFSNTFKDADDATKKLANTGKSLMAWGTALTTAGIAGTYALSNMAIAATEANDIQASYNKIVGSDSIKVLKDYQKSVLNTINDVEGMTAINKLLIRGIKKEQIPLYGKLAVQLQKAGLATGEVSDIVDNLTMAYTRGNTRLLQQYGIIVNQDEAYKKYALSIGKTVTELTDLEKRTAMQNEIQKQLLSTSEKMPQPAADYAEKLKQVNASMDNLKVSIGNAVLPIFERLINVIKNIVDWFNNLTDTQKKIIGWALLIGFALSIFAGIVLFLAGAFIILSTAAGILDIALAPLIIVILLIAAAIGVFIYIIYLLITEWDNLKLAAMALGTAIQNIFKWIGDIIMGFFKIAQGVFMMILGVLKWLTAKWNELWLGMAISLIEVWNSMIKFLETAVQAAVDKLLKPINAVRAWLGKSPIVIDVDYSSAMIGTEALQSQLKKFQDVTIEKSMAPGLAKVAEGATQLATAFSKETVEALSYQATLDRQSEAIAKAKYEEQSKTAELQKQLGIQQNISAEMTAQEKVNALTGYKVQYSIDPTTGEKTMGDIYNPRSFAASEFQSDAAYEQAKQGAGMNITIENIYGMKADEIAKALAKQLTNKTSGFSTTT